MGPKAGLDDVEKRKIACHYKESNPGRPAHSPSLYRLSFFMLDLLLASYYINLFEITEFWNLPILLYSKEHKVPKKCICLRPKVKGCEATTLLCPLEIPKLHLHKSKKKKVKLFL
jgi:hypothetical protein